MANLWLDLKGPILADTVYINGVLVAKDVTITLPAVTHVTADYKAMGTYTAPMTGQIEGMEAAGNKVLGIFGEETVNVLGVNLDIAEALGLIGGVD